MDRDRLIAAVGVLAEHSGLPDADLARLLVAAGYEIGQAHRLIAFVPIAFARPALEELGISEFADSATIATEGGGCSEVLLSDQPEFDAALVLAREHRRFGAMPHDWYMAITETSAEIDAASRALNEGADISGAAIRTALVNADLAKYVVRKK